MEMAHDAILRENHRPKLGRRFREIESRVTLVNYFLKLFIRGRQSFGQFFHAASLYRSGLAGPEPFLDRAFPAKAGAMPLPASVNCSRASAPSAPAGQRQRHLHLQPLRRGTQRLNQ